MNVRSLKIKNFLQAFLVFPLYPQDKRKEFGKWAEEQKHKAKRNLGF
jgi:hypothetical protein